MDYLFCDVGVSYDFFPPFDLAQNWFHSTSDYIALLENSLESACGRRLVPDLCNPGLFMSENDTKGALLHHGIEIDCFKIKFKLFSISDCNLTMMKLPCFIFSFYMSAVVSCI